MRQSKRALLETEGLSPSQITVEKDLIVEDENGFISWRMEHGYPYITHVYAYPDKRRGWNWLTTFIKFKNEIKAQGHDAFIAEVIGSKEFFVKFIRMFGCKEPYCINENGKYYLVRVR